VWWAVRNAATRAHESKKGMFLAGNITSSSDCMHRKRTVAQTCGVVGSEQRKKRQKERKKSKLSGGESNPGLLRVVLSNDKQKY
jgi:hypothetical protein